MISLLSTSLLLAPRISIDYVTSLPQCRRHGKIYEHVLVVVDQLTKMRHFVPVTGLTTDELVEEFVQFIYASMVLLIQLSLIEDPSLFQTSGAA